MGVIMVYKERKRGVTRNPPHDDAEPNCGIYCIEVKGDGVFIQNCGTNEACFIYSDELEKVIGI